MQFFEKLSKPQNNKEIVNGDDKGLFETVAAGPIHWQWNNLIDWPSELTYYKVSFWKSVDII